MTSNSLSTSLSGEVAPQKVDLKGFKGFTLAEVLITLVIIGVIAAMTIPTLMNNTNKQEYVSKLKKTYSTLAQATNRIIADEGNPRGDIGGWATSSSAVYNLYKKYLSVSKECADGTCGLSMYYQMNGNVWINFNDKKNYTFILADGTSFSLEGVDPTCNSATHGTVGICVYINVDINGAKGPNTIGKDTFRLVLKEDGLFPQGCDSATDICVTQNDGFACACKVLREGAMNY